MSGSSASCRKNASLCEEACSRAASIAAFRSVPVSTSVAPSSRMRAAFTGFGLVGRKTIAGTSSSRPAYATAAPWFPVLAVTTDRIPPLARFTDRAWTAPRTLNEPVGNSDSSFR
jgi:hypothetical protein